jgi:hypothetical protein
MRVASDYSFLTAEMAMSSNLVPAKYAGQDVRLLYSPTNPTHLGWWFSTKNGHERVYLHFLARDLGMTAKEIEAIPVAYMVEQ